MEMFYPAFEKPKVKLFERPDACVNFKAYRVKSTLEIMPCTKYLPIYKQHSHKALLHSVRKGNHSPFY